MPALTLYFDGHCARGAAEMTRLKKWDCYGALAFVDIATPDFDPAVLGVTIAALGREIHSVDGNGRMLIGIDSLLAVYTLVGKRWLVWPLGIAMLRPVLSAAYRVVARHRYRFSRWLGYRQLACENGVCAIGNPFLRGQ